MADYRHDLQFGIFITPAADRAAGVLQLARLADAVGLDLVTFQDHPYQPKFLDTKSASSSSPSHDTGPTLPLPERYSCGRRSVIPHLLDVDDPHLRAAHQGRGCAATAPQLFEGAATAPRLPLRVELELDHHVVPVVDRADDPVAAHAEALAVDRIPVEGGLPHGEVLDGVLQLNDRHLASHWFPSSGHHELIIGACRM